MLSHIFLRNTGQYKDQVIQINLSPSKKRSQHEIFEQLNSPQQYVSAYSNHCIPCNRNPLVIIRVGGILSKINVLVKLSA